jgi:SAM-dependent methyltransferase
MSFKGVLNNVHSVAVMGRRVERLSRALSVVFESGGSVLDVGCGDGSVAFAVQSLRADLSFSGVDVFLRPKIVIPAAVYNGKTIPYEDGAFDYVMIVDVLHHTDDPAALLTECLRVAKYGAVVKDHILSGFAASVTLRFMDWVGNRGHDVRLPYNYLDQKGWQDVFDAAGGTVVYWNDRLELYPVPFSWVFDRSLHFVGYVRK